MAFLEYSNRPDFHSPLLIMAFEGWNDAGDAASSAAQYIAEQAKAETFAELDPELFYDFQTTRPMVRLQGANRQIDWPQNTFAHGSLGGRELIILRGIEPQLRWRTYGETIRDLAIDCGVEMVVSLGALIADVVHTRPATIYGSALTPELRDRLDLEPSTYEGPTGIVGVVHTVTHTAGLDSVSLWGAVPSYVPHARSPKVSKALVERVSNLLDLPIPLDELRKAAEEYEAQINLMISDDDDMAEYVANLEAEYDAAMSSGSGNELIAKIEEFLKEQ
ncbi:MAG: PAC2 family protein [Acidimicrobiales bacterium]